MPHRLNRNAPQIVEILTDVPGHWQGWRFSASGRHLIGPDGDRITPQRLAGLLWRDTMELRRAGLNKRGLKGVQGYACAARQFPSTDMAQSNSDWTASVERRTLPARLTSEREYCGLAYAISFIPERVTTYKLPKPRHSKHATR